MMVVGGKGLVCAQLPAHVAFARSYNTARPTALWHLEWSHLPATGEQVPYRSLLSSLHVMPIISIHGIANLSHPPPSVSSVKLLTFWICPRCNQVSTSKYITLMSSKGVQTHPPCRSSTYTTVRTRTH